MTILILFLVIGAIAATMRIIVKKSKGFPVWQKNKIFGVFSLISSALSIFVIITALCGYFLQYLPKEIALAIGNMSLGIVIVPFVLFIIEFICFLIQIVFSVRLKEKKSRDRYLFIVSCIFFILSCIAMIAYIVFLNKAFSDFGFLKIPLRLLSFYN